MRLTTLAGAAAAMLLASTAAPAPAQDQGQDPSSVAEQCRADIDAFGQAAMGEAERPLLTLRTDRALRTLRSAALVLAEYGREDACQAMLAEMRDLMVNQSDTAGGRLEAGAGNRAMENAGLLYENRGVLQVDELVGANVYGTDNALLGEIESVAVNPVPGGASFALLTAGGFLGLGETVIPVPWSQFYVTEETGLFFLDLDAEAFAGAPTLNSEEYSLADGSLWVDQIDLWWQENAGE
ncbi:MAG: PRC-barrel domain-containing protein [Azospirillaceae bacterium]